MVFVFCTHCSRRFACTKGGCQCVYGMAVCYGLAALCNTESCCTVFSLLKALQPSKVIERSTEPPQMQCEPYDSVKVNPTSYRHTYGTNICKTRRTGKQLRCPVLVEEELRDFDLALVAAEDESNVSEW